jgi:alkylation response protein AidB-like acyl-CoA dehydrogenase
MPFASRQAFLKPIVEGRWTGTMCLTEPHCGTDLGLLKSKAVPLADGASAFGTHKISGTKIFITAGEHDLTENIVHLVLARLPDAPAGVKGISLFIVPKYADKSGQIAERNGDLRRDRAQDGHQGIGHLRDEFRRGRWLPDRPPNRGPMAINTMMNTARLAVASRAWAS